MLPAVMSASFLKGFRSKHLDLSLRGTLEMRSGSGFASRSDDPGSARTRRRRNEKVVENMR